MSQRQSAIIVGVWVIVFLFLGFPSSWEKAFAILTGILIIAMAYRIRFKEGLPSKGSSSFTDNLPDKPENPPQTPDSNPPATSSDVT